MHATSSFQMWEIPSQHQFILPYLSKELWDLLEVRNKRVNRKLQNLVEVKPQKMQNDRFVGGENFTAWRDLNRLLWPSVQSLFDHTMLQDVQQLIVANFDDDYVVFYRWNEHFAVTYCLAESLAP